MTMGKIKAFTLPSCAASFTFTCPSFTCRPRAKGKRGGQDACVAVLGGVTPLEDDDEDAPILR